MTNNRASKIFAAISAYELTPSRLGLAGGALALFVSTAYMNISGWVAQADSASQAFANAAMAGGFELMALCGLAWAGYQYSKGRWGPAAITAAIAIAAIIFNTFAAQNFLHLQADELTNLIEMSGYTLSADQLQIDTLKEQVDSLIAQNGGTIPRPVEAIEAQYAHLDPDANPINMGRKDAEIALRTEYDRLQAEIDRLMRGAADNAVTANDTARTVIPTSMLGPFIWMLEAIKGTVFFALGTTSGASKRSKQATEHRKKWAIIRARQREAEKQQRRSQRRLSKRQGRQRSPKR